MRAVWLCLLWWLVIAAPQAGEDLFLDAFNKHHRVMLLIDPQAGDIVKANPAAAEFYGYSVPQLETMGIQQINLLSLAQVAAERQRAAAEQRNYFIFRHRLANGEERTVSVSSVPIQFQQRHVLYSIITDITGFRDAQNALWHYQNNLEQLVDEKVSALEAAQQRRDNAYKTALLAAIVLVMALVVAVVYVRRQQVFLQQERQRLAEVIWGTGAGTWEWHIDGDWVSVNRRWCEQLGYDIERIAPLSSPQWQALCHPDDLSRFKQRLRQHLSQKADHLQCEVRLRHANGHWLWFMLRGKVVERNRRGRALRLCGTQQDISKRKALQQELEKQATLDHLTGLPNRALFSDRLQQATLTAERKQWQLAVLFIDLDGFKSINDDYGHDAGDDVLRQTAERLQRSVRCSDVVARQGGDEFVILMQEVSSQESVALVAEIILDQLRQPFHLPQGAAPTLSASIGIVLRPANSVAASQLISLADQAMYDAKRSGKNNYCFAELAGNSAQS
ncbi:hypothetical protein CHH28_08390 [Bacterioplanes sanyensis]|uniref:Diguanylate cyclase n=1 Tax=Bacterioplanes sanyensis TaxID=1249553 RepID=A0A222FI09_9GAMM|nr:diguanylate cyclase [Bacterioplanes sanyensis]ASP38697.1 hypothetical protein CHH28_08390 [Bacterioplanes sanyensis]